MYLFLNSQDSLSVHPKNTSFDFTVELPQPINVDGKSKIALSEINYSEVHEKDLYVYCDVCDYSYVKDGYKPILRIVNKSCIYNKLIYIPISSSYIPRIRIYIRDENNQIPSFNIETLRCTVAITNVSSK